MVVKDLVGSAQIDSLLECLIAIVSSQSRISDEPHKLNVNYVFHLHVDAKFKFGV